MSYYNRLKNLQNRFQELQIDLLLIEDLIDIYYLTGLNLSAGKLLVSLKGACLIVDNRYFELCQKASPFPVLTDPPNLEVHLASPDFSYVKALGFDSDKTTYKNYQQLEKLIENVGKSTQNPHLLKLFPIDNPLKSLRAIKDHEEIALLREAAILGSLGFDYVCSLLKEGISEKEIALELEIFWKRRGGKTVAFEPIIAFGANSSMPHYRAGDQKLMKGDIVLIDIGVNYRHYHSDMTRIAFFGNANPQLLSIHALVQKAQQAALAHCRPGILVGELDRIARDIIASHGYGQNFTHSLGHGVGLQIHEFPTIKNIPPFKDTILKSGMVITIEPGIYLPNLGGVRIEDTVVITEDGYENLTKRDIAPVFL